MTGSTGDEQQKRSQEFRRRIVGRLYPASLPRAGDPFRRISGAFVALLPHAGFSRTLKGMEVHFAPDTQAQLNQLAASQGKAAEKVVEETVARVLRQQAQFIEGVNRGIAAADRGELIDHAEVVERIDRLFRS